MRIKSVEKTWVTCDIDVQLNIKVLQNLSIISLFHLAWKQAYPQVEAVSAVTTEQTAAFKAQCNERQNRWAELWLLAGLQHCNIFLPPSHVFLLRDKSCMLFWLCWHPVSCVQDCLREGTYNRAFLVQVKEAEGSSLLLSPQEEQQTSPLLLGHLNNSKTASNCCFSPGI